MKTKEAFVNIVENSSSKREVLKIGDISYIFIPLSKKEEKLFGGSLINPCWRISIC